MQIKRDFIFSTLRIITLLAAAGLGCAQTGRAAVYSTNTGVVPGADIHYTVTIEDDKVGRMGIRFRLKNNSDKPHYLQRSAFDVPGGMSVFFSTEETPVVSSTADWVSDVSSSGTVMGSLPLLPGATLDEIFPIGFYYDKIYKRRLESNVYIYWGVTMTSASDDAELAAWENRTAGPITREVLPRIGGMLMLPKKVED